MFIQIDRKVECSKCGSPSYESFSTATEQGKRCLRCGHEKREPHPHLTHAESSGTVSWQKQPDHVEKF